jgi:uncharacterized protein
MQYHPPGWLKSGHTQTIWPLLIKGEQPALHRKRWKTPDDDFIDVDFLAPQEGQPLVILFHGLEGSSRSHYARSLMREVTARRWNGAIVHFRGCSGEPNLLPRAYHSGDANEIDWILRRFAKLFADIPRYAVGVSLGGNALLCWLGSRGKGAEAVVGRAAAISAPLDLIASGNHLAHGFNTVYTQYLLRTMRQRAAYKAKRFPGSFDAKGAIHARTLEEFDNAYTAPMHGFADANDYWRRASSKPLLRSIEVPTLVLNARNDPFLPSSALPKPNQVSSYVRLEQPEEGGHVGFVTGPFPGKLDWMPKRVLHYFDSYQA